MRMDIDFPDFKIVAGFRVPLGTKENLIVLLKHHVELFHSRTYWYVCRINGEELNLKNLGEWQCLDKSRAFYLELKNLCAAYRVPTTALEFLRRIDPKQFIKEQSQ